MMPATETEAETGTGAALEAGAESVMFGDSRWSLGSSGEGAEAGREALVVVLGLSLGRGVREQTAIRGHVSSHTLLLAACV